MIEFLRAAWARAVGPRGLFRDESHKLKQHGSMQI